MTVYTRIQHRNDTASDWGAADPVLAAGELGFVSDTGEVKLGDGANPWSDVPFGDRTAYRECASVHDGLTDDRSAIAAADTAAAASGVPILFKKGTYRVASNLTVASPVRFQPGAVIEPDNGVTVTFSGGVDAPTVQVFDESSGGTVVPHNTSLYAEWWGAVADDSTDSTAGLAAAGAAAKALGGRTVDLLRGTYLVSADWLPDACTNLTVRGHGDGTAIRTVSDHALVRAQNASGVCIRDVLLIGDSDGGKTSQMGVRFDNVTDSLVHNVHVKDTGYDGICLLVGCERNVVSNNRVEDCGDDGINVGGQTTTACVDNVVTGNTITGAANTGVHLSDRSSFTTVSANTVEGCNVGIDTYNTATYFGGGSNVITGNIFRNNTLFSIHIKDSDDNTIIGNKVYGSQRSVRIWNSNRCQFIGNNFDSPTSSAFLDSENVALQVCADLTLADNVFHGATASVKITSARAQFRGNRIDSIASGPALQLISTADSAVVSGNTFVDNAAVNVEINDAPRCVVSNNHLVGGTTSLSVTSSATECVVTGNVISGGTRSIQIAAVDCTITGNTLYGPSEHCLYLSTAARANISGNAIKATSAIIPVRITSSATDCSVSGNTIKDGTRGISAEATDTLITGNVFDGQSEFGAYAAGIARTHIVGNNFNNQSRAINIFGATNTFVTNNVTVNTSERSLSEDATSTGTVVAHNRFDSTVVMSGTSPVRIQAIESSAYTPTNVSTDRAFDADTVVITELADVVGTLIADLQANGIIG